MTEKLPWAKQLSSNWLVPAEGNYECVFMNFRVILTDKELFD